MFYLLSMSGETKGQESEVTYSRTQLMNGKAEILALEFT